MSTPGRSRRPAARQPGRGNEVADTMKSRLAVVVGAAALLAIILLGWLVPQVGGPMKGFLSGLLHLLRVWCGLGE
jgi:hypothetical protein